MTVLNLSKEDLKMKGAIQSDSEKDKPVIQADDTVRIPLIDSSRLWRTFSACSGFL